MIIAASLTAAVLCSWFWSQYGGESVVYGERKAPAKRIVSGYTAFTEILIALGAENRIVAATTRDAAMLSIASIGSHMKPDIEAIVACRPDLVLLSSRRPALVEQVKTKLSGLEAAVFTAHPTTVDDALDLINSLGSLTNKKDTAAGLIRDARVRLESVAVKIANVPESERPLVFLEVRSSPSLLSCGKESIAYDIIRRAGGRPLCTLAGSVVRMDIEAVIDGRPDFYIQQTGAMNRNPQDLTKHQILGSLECIREGRFVRMDEALISRPGPRVAEAVEKVYGILYGENNER